MLKKISETFSAISALYTEQNGQLTPKTGEDVALRRRDLEALVEAVVRVGVPKSGSRINTTEECKSTFYFLVAPESDGWVLTQVSNVILGEGGFGIVYKVWNIGRARFEALKVAKYDLSAAISPYEALRGENELRTKIDQLKGGKAYRGLPGVAVAFYDLFNSSHPSKWFVAMQMELLGHSVIDEVLGADDQNRPITMFFLNRTAADIDRKYLAIADSLFEGLDLLHENGIILNDIRAPNLLFIPKTEQVQMIDLGVLREHRIPPANSPLGPWDESSVPVIDRTEIGSLVRNQGKSALPIAQTDPYHTYLSYRKKLDVFQLATAIYQLITKGNPFGEDTNGHPKGPIDLRHAWVLGNPTILKKFNTLFTKAITLQDPLARPSAKEALSILRD